MQPGFLITDGGPHPSEKWAIATAGQIIQIAADAKGVQAIEGRKLELKIIDVLEGHHDEVQKKERAQLAGKGADKRAAADVDPFEHDIEAKMKDICAAAKGTPFEAHFGMPETQKHIMEVLASHFATSMSIERSWYRDRAAKSA
jgi:hypothetical protein